jgi:hypothetical protein
MVTPEGMGTWPTSGVRVAVVEPDTAALVRFHALAAYDRARAPSRRTQEPLPCRTSFCSSPAWPSGCCCSTRRGPPANAHQALNAVILHVSLPAVTLRALHGFTFDPNQLWPVLMPWALFAVGAAAFWGLGRWLRLPRASVGALTLVGGLGNTSFVGLPMIESLHGRDGLGLGLLIDQLGSYLALATIGVFVAALYAGDAPPRARRR